MRNRSLKTTPNRTVLGIALCGWMLVHLPISAQAQLAQAQSAASRLEELKQVLKNSRSDSSRSLTEAAIKAELSSQYDVLLEANDADLNELEKRVARLKQDLLKRRAAKKQMVDIELQRIINEVNGIVWPSGKLSSRSGDLDTRDSRITNPTTEFGDMDDSGPYGLGGSGMAKRELSDIIERNILNLPNAASNSELGNISQSDLSQMRQTDLSQMRQIYAAVIAYRSVLQKFPANVVDNNGKPLLSWRVQVLPFMGEAESKLYKKFKLDESWDSKHNLPLLKQMPAIFKSSHVEDNTKTTFLRVDGRLSKPINKVQCFLVNSDPSRSAIEWSKPSSVSVAELRQSQYPSIVLYTDGVMVQLKDGITEDEAEEFIKSHVGNLMSKDLSEVSNSYASNVQLMAGHEFLKPKFKLGTDDVRSTGARVDRKRLLDALKAVFATSRAKDPELVKKMVSGLNVTIIETEAGDFSVAPSDPATTKSGQLNFSIVPRDVLLKVSVSDHPDFMLFQVRRIDGTLRVVAEYLD